MFNNNVNNIIRYVNSCYNLDAKPAKRRDIFRFSDIIIPYEIKDDEEKNLQIRICNDYRYTTEDKEEFLGQFVLFYNPNEIKESRVVRRGTLIAYSDKAPVIDDSYWDMSNIKKYKTIPEFVASIAKAKLSFNFTDKNLWNECFKFPKKEA